MADFKICKTANVKCKAFSNGFCESLSPCSQNANFSELDAYQHKTMSFILLRYLGNVLTNQQKIMREQEQILKMFSAQEKQK